MPKPASPLQQQHRASCCYNALYSLSRNSRSSQRVVLVWVASVVYGVMLSLISWSPSLSQCSAVCPNSSPCEHHRTWLASSRCRDRRNSSTEHPLHTRHVLLISLASSIPRHSTLQLMHLSPSALLPHASWTRRHRHVSLQAYGFAKTCRCAKWMISWKK
jgi:hypothetical protein